MRIALVEDDTHVGQLESLWLEEAGFQHQLFVDGASFQKAASRESFDLVILDWMLPDTNGDDLLAWLRQHYDWRVPVVFVTARDSEEDIVRMLSLGADDYIVKPVRRGEFLARIQAVGRRVFGEPETKGTLSFPPFAIDLVARTIVADDQPVDLTQKEFELALFMFRNAGRLISRTHILESVWGHRGGFPTRTVDTHMSRVRAKLGFGQDSPWRLQSIYNHGYRLERVESA